jgi:hypothetical protein
MNRREIIATAALQGVLASYAGDRCNLPPALVAAAYAAEYADALIANLDETTPDADEQPDIAQSDALLAKIIDAINDPDDARRAAAANESLLDAHIIAAQMGDMLSEFAFHNKRGGVNSVTSITRNDGPGSITFARFCLQVDDGTEYQVTVQGPR